MRNMIKKAYRILRRNALCRDGSRAAKHRMNLEYYTGSVNLGDALAPVVFRWMLERKHLTPETRTPKTGHLMTIGSLLGGSGLFDAAVWGTGVRSYDGICSIGKRRRLQKLDIRAVRGPVTRQILQTFGYSCPQVYGDPAVLMPLIYRPQIGETEKNGIGLIQHYLSSESVPAGVKCIDIQTTDYRQFIDRVAACEKIISSSLHGIILAETYGIPAVFLGKSRESELLKYYDWYHSTGRYNVRIAMSVEEAMGMEPMDLPDLHGMQENLIKAFPYDLWEG